mmetsp:Transcript_119263/g.178169  ORF Transcript_119263/g.178169 Transcript_119263/m.178169 type:complete len:420 (-) Transcript_119263:43-1302(-)|eukprot:CAMPEP_0117017264 /NCGR_PEP_ID=MMETSP0472-20121206/13510_1 /TAXON_ID=693140 ORGANISM="Tiarina fusus, Strain LIS" /NCGR_SAMPLE_ID=MMETSP0472 /ASSEMBLY_ACC=CAM_ASM_000603 /LENGTH=419 /DNA_ID=CAMNT_0004721591 /DNA_START=264 /DNA_END=1523 /DNA_ORIENTATION=+
MGGNRKSSRNSGSSHNQQQHRNSDTDASNSSAQKPDVEETKAALDFNKVLQEVEGGFQVTWKEIVLALVAVGLLAILSICLGIAAGMTISIHYYENQSPAVRRMDPRDTSTLYNGHAASQRVTTLDPSIASSNVLQKDRDGLDLGKVITTTASGQLNVLMVVEEADPIDGTTKTSPQTKAGHAHTVNYDPTSNTSPMTMEEATKLVPDYDKWKASQPTIDPRKSTIHPTLCSDGYTRGFNNWATLKAAVQEANSISAERFMKWSAYFAYVGKSFSAFEDESLYYEQDVLFTICPGVTLKSRRGPIYINAENVVIECVGCTIDVGGTHLAFGPHAKNVLVRGITFKGAHSSSLTFFHDGAEASFEDCFWIGNSGISGKFGAVADVNSTSTVNFYRCEIGQGPKGFGGVPQGSASSLSIRA